VNRQDLRPLTAEFVGTALFVFLGAGSIVANAAAGNAYGALGPALAHGIALAILVTATMSISGGHLNPAVTFGLSVAKQVDWKTALKYVGAQLAGAVLGALLIKLLLPRGAVNATSAGTPELGRATLFFQGIWIEALLTFVLVSVVFGTAVSAEAPKVGGFAIGLAVFVDILVGGGFTGAAMNPARAFGPALVAWDWHAHAVYWIGPLLGGAAAGLLWKLLLLPKDPLPTVPPRPQAQNT